MTDRNTDSTDRMTISVDEAAKLLGISRSFAYELCARRELPVIRLGRRVVVRRQALLDLILETEDAAQY